jgi:uncharacterized protein
VETSLAVLDIVSAGKVLGDPRPVRAASAGRWYRPSPQAVWAAELDRCGPVPVIGDPVSEPATTVRVVVKVPVTYERGALTVVVSVDEVGRLVGLQLAPAGATPPVGPWEPPAYAHPDTFDEQAVTVGPARWRFPAP